MTWQWTCRRLRQARRLLAYSLRDQRAGRLAVAEQRGRRALELLRRDARHRHLIDRLAICQAVANLQQARAAYDSAAALLEQALEIAQGEAAAELQVEPLVLLGNLRRLQGRHREAETCLLRARALADHAQLPGWRQARVLNGLALIHKDTANYEEAAKLYRQALQHTAQNDLLARATLQHNLAGLAHAQGQFVQAEPPARCAVELRTAVLGHGHPEVAADLAVLGAVLYGQQRHDEAERVFNEALTAFQQHYGPDHYEVAVNLGNLGALYAATDRADQAQQCYDRALDIKRRLLGATHPEIATLLNNLAVLHKQQGRLPAARECYAQALTVFESTLGPEHPSTRTCRDNLERLPPRASSPSDSLGSPQPPLAMTRTAPVDQDSPAELTWQTRGNAKPADHRPERTGGAMDRHRTPILATMATIAAIGGLVAAALLMLPAQATPPSHNVITNTIGVGHFTDIDTKVKTDIDPGPATEFWRARIKTKRSSDLYVLENTIPPGETFGWHSHPGPSLVIVKSGTATFYLAADPTCTPHVVPAGSGFVDQGHDVHVVRNEGSVDLVTVVVSLVPAGFARRIDEPSPGCLPNG